MPFPVVQASQASLLIIDAQEKLFSVVENSEQLLKTSCFIIKAFKLLDIPILCSEQYPQGLGQTHLAIRNELAELYLPLTKCSFSCLSDPSLLQTITHSQATQWIVIGLEAHICVLQTVKDLVRKGNDVIVLQDGISSAKKQEYLCAIEEMRNEGARISCSETIIFELLNSSKHASFSQISQLVKMHRHF